MSNPSVMTVPCPKCSGAGLDKRIEAAFYEIKEKNRIGRRPPACAHCQGRGVRELRPNDKHAHIYVPQTKADARAEAIEDLEKEVYHAEAQKNKIERVIKRGRPARASA